MTLNLLRPCKTTILLWSGICNILMILPTVPYSNKSSKSGSSTLASFCAITPTIFVVWLTSLINFKLLSLPMVMGIMLPGYKTALRNVIIGSSLGTRSLLICFSSSADITGKKSSAPSLIKKAILFINSPISDILS